MVTVPVDLTHVEIGRTIWVQGAFTHPKFNLVKQTWSQCERLKMIEIRCPLGAWGKCLLNGRTICLVELRWHLFSFFGHSLATSRNHDPWSHENWQTWPQYVASLTWNQKNLGFKSNHSGNFWIQHSAQMFKTLRCSVCFVFVFQSSLLLPFCFTTGSQTILSGSCFVWPRDSLKKPRLVVSLHGEKCYLPLRKNELLSNLSLYCTFQQNIVVSVN